MQKDFHFYVTYALARKVGICANVAQKIAWANQFTDDNHKADLHGMRTQCAVYKDWYDRTVQHDVIVPFHFVPGNGDWLVIPGSDFARALVKKSLNNPFRLGIALHALQDTYSHQGFTGWDEKNNACYPWYYIESTIPNVGHAEMRAMPDIANIIWTDLRTGKRIDNKKRAMKAAKATYDFLVEFNDGNSKTVWPEIAGWLRPIFKMNYDQRKTELRKLSGNRDIHYKQINTTLWPAHKSDFIQAARKHLAAFLKSL